MNFLTDETFPTDYSEWTIGPYHDFLVEPMRLHLRLDGEIIVSGEVETGFLHRGLERSIEASDWEGALVLAGHLDPEHSFFGELALCSAVEEVAQIEVPERARFVRELLAELTRVQSHLSFLARMAKALNSKTMLHYALRDRERILDLFELIAGARFSLHFLRYGGVTADVTEGFLERTAEFCDLILLRMQEYNDLLSKNRIFIDRTRSVGEVSADQAARYGLHSLQGDAYSRYCHRMDGIFRSVQKLRELMGSALEGPFISSKSHKNMDEPFRVPAGESWLKVMTTRGELGCHLVSSGGEKPQRVQFKTPSAFAILLLPELFPGTLVEDLPVLIASLDISIAEVDR